ncbi:MAG TPA: SEC-C metal-binding domain-containing protein, partial [Casimicrobiaceae bacterium]
IAKAQNRVESRNFDIRKQLLEYDDVANDQRRVIYQQRDELLETEDISETIRNMISGQIEAAVRVHIPPESVEEQWDIPGLEAALAAEYHTVAPVAEWMKTEPELSDETIRNRVGEVALAHYEKKVEQVGGELFHPFERNLMLQTVDKHWREHLAALDYLRQGIHLRGYAQKNPKQEYKREAFELFSDMLDRIKHEVVQYVLTLEIRTQQDVQAVEEVPVMSNVNYQHADYDEALAAVADAPRVAASPPPFTRAGQKVGRNDPCPCGSGKKYKHCHGRI